MTRILVPPFTVETARRKVRAMEDVWNGQDAEAVARAYTEDCRWRNRNTFLRGRAAIVPFLHNKWESELDYRLIAELWAVTDNRLAVRFAYEYHDDSDNWFRAYGNENWEFDASGLIRIRHSSINDFPLMPAGRLLLWDRSAPRPADHPELSALGL